MTGLQEDLAQLLLWALGEPSASSPSFLPAMPCSLYLQQYLEDIPELSQGQQPLSPVPCPLQPLSFVSTLAFDLDLNPLSFCHLSL